VNGPNHYREGEAALDKAWHFLYGDGADPATGAGFAAVAQAHFAAAQAAATVEGFDAGLGTSLLKPVSASDGVSAPGDPWNDKRKTSQWGEVLLGADDPRRVKVDED
jgi:hypothetical protein